MGDGALTLEKRQALLGVVVLRVEVVAAVHEQLQVAAVVVVHHALQVAAVVDAALQVVVEGGYSCLEAAAEGD